MATIATSFTGIWKGKKKGRQRHKSLSEVNSRMNNYYFPNWCLDIVHLASTDSIACWSWPNSIFNFLVWVLPFVVYIFGLILSQSIFLQGFLSCLKLWEPNIVKGTTNHLEPQDYQFFFYCLYSPLFSLFQIMLLGQYWKSMGILTSLCFPWLWQYCFSLFSIYILAVDFPCSFYYAEVCYF